MKKLFNRIAPIYSDKTNSRIRYLCPLLGFLLTSHHAISDTMVLNRDGTYTYTGAVKAQIDVNTNNATNWPVGSVRNGSVYIYLNSPHNPNNRLTPRWCKNRGEPGGVGVAVATGATKGGSTNAYMEYSFTKIDTTNWGSIACIVDYEITRTEPLPPSFYAYFEYVKRPDTGMPITNHVISRLGLQIDNEWESKWHAYYPQGTTGGITSGSAVRRAGANHIVPASSVSVNYSNNMTIKPNEERVLLAVSGFGSIRLKYRITGPYLRIRGGNGVINPDTWVTLRPNDSLSVSAVGVPYGVHHDTVTVDAELI